MRVLYNNSLNLRLKGHEVDLFFFKFFICYFCSLEFCIPPAIVPVVNPRSKPGRNFLLYKKLAPVPSMAEYVAKRSTLIYETEISNNYYFS